MQEVTLTALDGPRFPPRSGADPRHLVVLLHGVGADGNDLIALAPILAESLPDATFVAPHAPEPYDEAPFGYQWFSLRDRSPRALLRGLRAIRPVVEGFIESELETLGLTHEDLAIVAFSQGTMTALHVAPRMKAPPAAVVGYSGALLAPELLEAETRVRPPILLIHGDADPLVPVESLPAAVDALEDAGFPVESTIRPGLAHGIDPEGIAEGAAFVRVALEGF